MPPRPLRPKEEPCASDSNDAAGESKSSKRRAVSSACIPCRKRKSKCDGSLPSCSTCTAVYRTECNYDVDSDHRRKGALKRDLQSLQQRSDALDVIVASLRSLPEDEAVNLLHSLRGDANPDVLAAGLRTNVRLPHSFAPQTLEADFAQHMSQATPASSVYNTTPSTPASHSRKHSHEGPSANDALYDNSTTWFRTPQEAGLVEHLLNLYFCWAHPFYHFFSRDHFLHDMERGQTGFCSAMLVNALLAFACHYSDRPAARADHNDPNTAGDRYFAEAKRLLDCDEKSCLTTVQALGIMSVREASYGRDSNAYQLAGRCLRMALELGLHLSAIGSGLRPSEAEVRKITFWSVFNIETICSVGFGRLTQLPRAAADVQKPSLGGQAEAPTWRPYEESGLALSPSAEQAAHPMLFIQCVSRLSELASDMVNTFYAPQERFTSRRLAATYVQYQEWHDNLPDVFRLENTSLPHVIVLHMYYYACILHLFRPYIKLDLRGAGLFPRDACTHSANEISALMNALRAMYGLRRVCLPVTSFLMSAGTIHLLNLPSEQSAAHLGQGLQDLQVISVNHQFAARCADIIRSLARKWNISLPETAAFGRPGPFPSPPSSTFFAASIPRQPSSSRSQTKSADSAIDHHEGPFAPPAWPSQNSQQQQQQQQQMASFYSDPLTPMDSNSAQNPFWTPFPVQGFPSQSQDWNSMMFDFSQQANGVAQWPVFDGTNATAGTTHAGGAGGAAQESMGGTLPDWSWQ